MAVATATGLSTAEAAARRAEQGPNRFPEPRRPSAARRFAGELTHFFALMLWVAGALAIVARLPELGLAIFAVILLNAVFAFAQQARADRAAERLRAMLPTRVTVRRDSCGQSCTYSGGPTPASTCSAGNRTTGFLPSWKKAATGLRRST